MSLPIVFFHRTADDYLFYILQQAKMASPHSEVVLIGSPQNSTYATGGIKHAMIHDYSHGATEFAKVYKHMSPCEYYYNLFCFQRWFILRDYMRSNRIDECWTLDSDIMLYADLNRPEYKGFSSEFTWTTYITLKDVEELCEVTQNHFSIPHLFEYLKHYTKETGNYLQDSGMLAISDMVTQRLHLEKYLKRDRTHGVISDSFFDNNLYFSFPGLEMHDNKKKFYLINGNLSCKKLDTGQYIKVNSVHFTTGANKKYIEHFYGPNLSARSNGAYFYDYIISQWLPTHV